MMGWKKIKDPEDYSDENLLEFIEFNKTFGCVASLPQETQKSNEDQLRSLKKRLKPERTDLQLYWYEDDDFKIYTEFDPRLDSDHSIITQFWIVWDFNDPTVDVWEAMRITAKHGYKLLKEWDGKPAVFYSLPFKDLPYPMSEWSGEEEIKKLVEIHAEEGVEVTYEPITTKHGRELVKETFKLLEKK